MRMLKAEDVAKTLVEIQCELYERHGASSAPAEEHEYDVWVAEATDVLTQLYGSVDLGLCGIELGRGMQMASDLNAHIAVEALGRALAVDDEADEETDKGCQWLSDSDNLIDRYEELGCAMVEMEQERALIAQAVALCVQRLVDIAGEVVDRGGTPSPMCRMVSGVVGQEVPELEAFHSQNGRPAEFVIRRYDSDAGGMVCVAETATGQEVMACPEELLDQPEYVVRKMIGDDADIVPL